MSNNYSPSSYGVSDGTGATILVLAAVGTVVGFFWGLFHWTEIALLAVGYGGAVLLVFGREVFGELDSGLANAGRVVLILSILAAVLLGGWLGGPDGVPFGSSAKVVLWIALVGIVLLTISRSTSVWKGILCGVCAVTLASGAPGNPPPDDSYEAHHPDEYRKMFQRSEIDVFVQTQTGSAVREAFTDIKWTKDGEDVWTHYWQEKETDADGKAVYEIWFNPDGLLGVVHVYCGGATEPDCDSDSDTEFTLSDGETKEVRVVVQSEY